MSPIQAKGCDRSQATRITLSTLQSFTVPLALSTIAILTFWLCGQPTPNVDDIFFLGSALHEAQHGAFANPTLAGLELPGSENFLYTPFVMHAPAFWIRAFGASGRSLRIYLLVLCWLSTFLFGLICATQTSGWLPAIVMPLVLLVTIAPLGFRPEPLAVLSLVVGALLAFPNPCLRLLRKVGVYFFAILAAATAPRLWVFALVLCAGFAYTELRAIDGQRPLSRTLGVDLVILSACVGVVLFLFGAAIEWKWQEWFEVFRINAGTRFAQAKAISPLQPYIFAWNKLFLTPILALAVIISIACCARRIAGWPVVAYLLVSAVTTITISGGDYGISHAAIVMAGIASTPLLCAANFRSRAIWYTAAVAAVMWWRALWIAGLLLSRPHLVVTSPDQAILESPDMNACRSKLYIDSGSLQYYFHYKLPNNALAWRFSKPIGMPENQWVAPSELEEGDCIFASNEEMSARGLTKQKGVRFLTLTANTVPLNPQHLVLLVKN